MTRRSTQRCGLRRQLLALTLGFAGMALSQGAAAQGSVAAGQASYDKTCVACHQPGGKGMAGLAPALAGTLAPLMGQEDGRRYVAGVLVHGLSGRIVSQGMTFVGAMPPQAALSDAELAEVANYLARSLNGAKDDVFKAEDFARERSAKTSHKDLRELRQRLLP